MTLNPTFDEHPMDIAILAGVRFSTDEPHAGGLERQTDTLARELVKAGHTVTVFAGSRDELDGHDVPYRLEPLVANRYIPSPRARTDVSMPPERFMAEHDAYLGVLDRLDDFDIIHNNSLHYLPVVSPIASSVVHVLHTPPTPWLESAYRIRKERRRCGTKSGGRSRVVAVSHANKAEWLHHVDDVVHNGVELDRWRSGTGGTAAVWSGRIVPEKGLHFALDAARIVGIDLFIAGPLHDPEYFDAEIRPRLSNGPGEYLGHLRLDDLAALTAGSAVSVVTPRWTEPFGLVAAESLACATPVAAFDRGALSEIVTDEVGALATPDDVRSLADAIGRAVESDRVACRRRAVDRFGAEVMTQRYIDTYRAVNAPQILRSA